MQSDHTGTRPESEPKGNRMNELQTIRRAEEIIRCILDDGIPIAVYRRNGEIAALPTDGKRCAAYMAEDTYPLIGIYDECCPVHWLAADIQHGAAK